MNRAVTVMAFVALAFLLSACGSTSSRGGGSEKDLGGQDLGPTKYNPKYPADVDKDGEAEEEVTETPAVPPRRAPVSE